MWNFYTILLQIHSCNCLWKIGILDLSLIKLLQNEQGCNFLPHSVCCHSCIQCFVVFVYLSVCMTHELWCVLSLQTPLLNEILVPLITDNTSVDRSYPSGSLSRRTVACKLSDVLYAIAQRLGIDMLRQHLTGPLQLFFAVFTLTSSTSGQTAATGNVIKTHSEMTEQTDAANRGMILLLCCVTLTFPWQWPCWIWYGLTLKIYPNLAHVSLGAL